MLTLALAVLTAADFSIVEAGIPAMQQALKQKKVTSRELVRLSLERIATYEPLLHATLYVNPRALAEADALDAERKRGKVRSPLHGIPIALKDNIHTTDMPTTGGALAFVGYRPPYDATLVKNLREAGAIIIAKTGMTELANWIGGAPTPMPTNYNAVGGFGFNPYDPRRDPRPDSDGRPVLVTGGSSSGIGTAASFWAGNVGTETSGSILSPATANMLAAVKPTVGRISRYGIIPITADQDTAGPMARSVTDAAIMLGVLESASPDPNDAATSRCTPHRDYQPFLKAAALKGARIGVPRVGYATRAEDKKILEDALVVLRAQGAVIVDPAEIPSQAALEKWATCGGADGAKGKDENCSVVLKYGMKRDFNAWLRTLGDTAPVKSMKELREWNKVHEKAGSMRYGQSRLDIADEMDLEADRARYEADRAKDIRLAGTEGIDAVMKAQNLDALLFVGASGASIAAKPGYPSVIVPFAMVPPSAPANRPFPAGFTPQPAPVGISFTGMACSEGKLLGLGYAFEQATRKRVAPPLR